MNGLINCSENCLYQKCGECTLENVPRFCLELNSKKACIYYVKNDRDKETPTASKKPASGFESYY